ncbi:conserved hypothetical protein [uncultured Eubacteriales bacterium]|uniref:DUF3102 domain-containing protein n=1 Tax=uncultured Eubacteriales bacterium TaxID=172733 RepID=A0A212IVD8_9FIRM|nr:conserved hypothetical protein [uncultured Eubacteriales bacterium]
MTTLLGNVMRTEAEMAPVENRNIEVITAEIQMLKANVGIGIVEIGNRLLEAKAQLQHGEWLPWLENQAQFSVSQANRFMRLAKEYSNSSALTNLGASKALALLAFESEEREAFAAESHIINGEEKTVVDMTSRELEQAIRERKEALEAKEAAEADKRIAEQSRDKLSQEMTIANAAMESQRETEAHLDGVMADLRKELEDLRKQPIDSTYSDTPDTAALDAARQEGATEAAKTAKKEAEDRLKAKIEKAEKAKADAEAQVKTIRAEQEATRAKSEALEKQLKLVSNPAATEYKVYFSAVQKDLAGLEDCLDRLVTSDPDLCGRLTSALAALGKQICDSAAARQNGDTRA